MKKTFPNPVKTSVVILAAGNSSRMGCPKFLLRYDEGFTFFEKIVHSYSNYGCNEIKIVINSQGIELLASYKSKLIKPQQLVLNLYPERDKFYSLQTGLKSLQQKAHVFIHMVDNPFVINDVLNLLLVNYDNGDYQVPYYMGKGGHPVLLSGKLVHEICKVKDYKVNLKDFLTCFTKFPVNTDYPEVLLNINTPEEYEHFLFYKNKSNSALPL